MKKIFITFLFVVGLCSVEACKNPDYVFSVMFTCDDIPVDLSLFGELGEEGVNYFHNSGDNEIVMTGFEESYTYRNHYNMNVLVNVGERGINFIIDTSNVNMDTLRVDVCTEKELEWLNNAGIVQIPKVQREEIGLAFYGRYESMIYWTKWDTLVASDLALLADTNCVLIRWVEEDCMGIIPQIEFPPQELGSTEIIPSNRFQPKKSQIMNANNNYGAYLLDGRIIKQNSEDIKKRSHSGNIILEHDTENGMTRRSVKMQ